jgi:hypothetical protein
MLQRECRLGMLQQCVPLHCCRVRIHATFVTNTGYFAWRKLLLCTSNSALVTHAGRFACAASVDRRRSTRAGPGGGAAHLWIMSVACWALRSSWKEDFCEHTHARSALLLSALMGGAGPGKGPWPTARHSYATQHTQLPVPPGGSAARSAMHPAYPIAQAAR